MKPYYNFRRTVLLFAVVLLSFTGASALTYTWTGASSTSFSDPTNWDLNNGQIPGVGDNVVIDNTSSANCDIDVAVDLGSGTFTLSTRQVIFSGGGDFNCNQFTINSGSVNFSNAGVLTLGYVRINGGTFNGSDRTFNFTFIDGNAGTWTAGTATYNLTRDLFVNSTCTFTQSNSGLFVFNGTSNQYIIIAGSGNLITNVTVNKPSGDVLQFSSFAVTGTITLTSGNWVIGNNDLILQTSSTPFARTSGQLSTGNTSVLRFGGADEGGSTVTLPSNLFASGSTLLLLRFKKTNNLVFNNNITIVGTIDMFGGSGSLDLTGCTITFQNGNSPITGYGSTTPTIITSSTTNLVFGTSGNTGGNAFTFANNVFASSNNTVGNITINRTNEIALGNQNLTIAGTLTLTAGAFNISGRTLTFHTANTPISMSAGTITTSATSSLIFGTSGNTGGSSFTLPNNVFTSAPTITNFTMNRSNGLTLGNQQVSLTGVLSVTGATLTTNGNLRLVSNASGTAQIGTLGSGGGISGNVTVERFIPSLSYTTNAQRNKLWRFMASAVSGVSFANGWQQTTHITGGSSGGFDVTNSNSPSCYTYDEAVTGSSGNGWTALANTTSTNQTIGTGYRLFIRGDRTVDLNTLPALPATQAAVTLSATGTVATGNQPLTVSCSNGCSDAANDGWNLVGNPFAATIDWESVSRTNVASTVYIFNPSLNSYATYQVGGTTTNGGSRFISSGQAFFVQASASPSLSVPESAKSVTNRNDLFSKTGLQNQIKVLLTDNMGTYSDEAVMAYRTGATHNFDIEYDAYKLGNGTGAISTYSNSNNTLLVINSHENTGFSALDTFRMNVNLNPASGLTYSMEFSMLNSFPRGTGIWLRDQFLNAVVDLRLNPRYTFTISSNAASYGANRFEVYVGPAPSLPVEFTKFTAQKNGNMVDLAWATASEKGNSHFVLQRSSDSYSYDDLATIKGSGNKQTTTEYAYTDVAPVASAINYYRLKQVDLDGKTSYTGIELADLRDGKAVDGTASVLKAWPLPAADNIHFTLSHEYNGEVVINVYNQVGKLVLTSTATAASDELSTNVSALSSGIYMLEVVAKTAGFSEQVKFIKE